MGLGGQNRGLRAGAEGCGPRKSNTHHNTLYTKLIHVRHMKIFVTVDVTILLNDLNDLRDRRQVSFLLLREFLRIN